MSPSRDNLPAVDEEKLPPAPATAEVLWSVARWVVGREWLMRLAAVAFILALGAAGVVYAQDAGVQLVAPVRAALVTHVREETEARQALERKVDLLEERSARRFEVLYNTILERRPQPGADELAKPQTDGGR